MTVSLNIFRGKMKINQCNLLCSYLSQSADINAAISKVLNSGWYILGTEVNNFETAFAEYNNARHCIGVANGTDAIEIVLRAGGIGQGDLVATVANTAVATVSAIERTGATPVFADILPDTFTMDPDSLKELLQNSNEKIKAVVPVHLFGHPANMPEIMEIANANKITVIEDCAQAHGASIQGQKVGTFGIAGTFSFYPTKNLGAFGDGGAVITNNKAFAHKIKCLRQYGWEQRYISSFSGINSRLDEIQAAILSVKLKKLNNSNCRRQAIAKMYDEGLKNIKSVSTPLRLSGYDHVYHQYVIKVEKARDSLKAWLAEREIETAIHYPLPIHLQPAYAKQRQPVSLEVTETINDMILSLPMYPALEDNDVSTIISSIRNWSI